MDYDYCYKTGNYTDQDCLQCPHRHECSGFDGGEDDEC